MDNPLLNQGALPRFSAIIPEQHIEAAVTTTLAENRKTLAALLDGSHAYTWDNLVIPLEEMGDRLAKVWSPVSHLHGVAETPALREAYNNCLPLLTQYHTDLMQNELLYKAIKSIADSPDYANLSPAQHKVIENDLRDFNLTGVSLPASAKARLSELQNALSQLTTRFAEQLMDATQAWTLLVTDETKLAGLPEQDLNIAAQTATAQGKTGWLLTLEYPCYAAVMTHLDNRELRRAMYEAYSTRASDQGPNAGQFDNSPLMNDILRLRHEKATLLGFKNFAEYSLATKMAATPKRVLDFLHDLVARSKAAAVKEMQELTAFAKSMGHTDTLETWDLAYFSEKLREQKYAISQEELKPYFPVQQVLNGMFTVVKNLYGIQIVEKTGIDTWHPQVGYYEIYDQTNTLRGSFYTDLFARPHKRDGAWMDECRIRRRLLDGTLQVPVAYLTCNFTRPVDDKPALLSQDEVETVFHEFGHCLHHLLTKIDYASISGINGVPWDAVEFPSQIMERWCFEKETVPLISAHYQTGEPLPAALYKKVLAAKNFQSGMQMLRQLEFSLFDFLIHLEYDPARGGRVQEILNTVRDEVAVVKYPAFNRFQHSFSHIFAGSYAAGYYSYKWAEVLSSDAYSLFEETGIFNPETGQSYLENILEKGGVRDPMESFIAFRGREPRIDALLQHSGL
jgi:oligopeptidase A